MAESPYTKHNMRCLGGFLWASPLHSTDKWVVSQTDNYSESDGRIYQRTKYTVIYN